MWLLLACTGSSVLIGGDDPVDDPVVEDLPEVDDTDTDDDDDTDDERDDEAFFSDDLVHVIEITLDAAAIDALGESPYDSVGGHLDIDGDELGDVGVRLRGKIGAFRTLDGKPKFGIDVNFLDPELRFLGLKALTLNNSVVDCSYLKEPLAYRVFRQAGVAAQRTGFARVSVNGDDYGLYVIVETPDDEFIERTFEDASGNLYDGKYIYDENTGGYTLLDFTEELADLYGLEEGQDVGHADVHGIVEAVDAEDDWYERVDAVVDMARFQTYLVAEQLVGHNDGYALNTNNNRIYFDPADDGRMVMVPWDFDYAYFYDYEWGFDWTRPSGVLARRCFRNPLCSEGHLAAIDTVLATYDEDALTDWYDARVDQLEDQIRDDPRRECGLSDVSYYQDHVRDWIRIGPEELRDTWE